MMLNHRSLARAEVPAKAKLLGLDLIRILAMSCVAIQHALTLSGIKPKMLLGYLNPGQAGVTIFCALSGYLALLPSIESPVRWLARRLTHIYVPYWLSLLAIFGANYLLDYKPSSAGLVISQFLGIGLLTHPNNLVGVTSWFITLILIFYIIAFFTRIYIWIIPIAMVASILCLERGLPQASHLLSFLAGSAIAAAPSRNGLARAAMLAFTAALLLFNKNFAYPLLGSASLLVAGSISGKSPPLLVSISRNTYEFFLVHGPIYLALSLMGRFSWMEILAIGTPLAAVTALFLSRLSAVIYDFGSQALLAGDVKHTQTKATSEAFVKRRSQKTRQ